MLLEGAASCFGFMALAGGPQAVHAASEEQNEQEEGLSLPRVGLNAGFVSGGYATLASTFFLSDGETAAASIQDNVNTLEEAATDLLQQTNFLEESSASTAISGLEECEMFVAATMASGVEELEESASAISGLEECGSFFTANSNMGEGTASTETFLDSSF